MSNKIENRKECQLDGDKPQRILVFQQNGSGEKKIRGIRQFSGELFSIATYDIDTPLPDLIENSDAYLPQSITADLVLDYLHHPDLSHDLWVRCEHQDIPVVASNKKSIGAWAVTPRTCCALPRTKGLGAYGQCFGAPDFQVTIVEGLIAGITVLRGAPCGATWEAARQTIGMRMGEAPVHIGLMTQYHCTADPAGWDVLHDKSPVHIAADLHRNALKKAIDRAS